MKHRKVHFVGTTMSRHTACNRWLGGSADPIGSRHRHTTDCRDVTCKQCRANIQRSWKRADTLNRKYA